MNFQGRIKMSNLYFIFYVLFIPIAILLSFMPYLTRKTENFGVSIPESLYDRLDFKQMRKNYTLLMLILSFIFTLLLLALHVFMSETAFLIGFTVILLIHLFLSFILYLPFHKKMRKVKQNENWHAELKQTLFIDTKFREQPVTHSAWWYIIPILIIMITIGATFALYNSAPEQI